MRKDVVKGVGWAILLSVVAIGAIAIDRMVRSTPAHAELAPVPVGEEIAAPAVAAPVVEPVQEVVAAVPAPEPVRRPSSPAVRPLALGSVPPPPSLPPLIETAVFAHPAPPKVLAIAHTQELRSVEGPAPAQTIVPDPPAPSRGTNSSKVDEKATPANPAVRAMRSMGRVLGLGRKEKDATPASGQ